VNTRLEKIKHGARIIGLIAEDSAKVVSESSVGSNTLSMISLSQEGGIAQLRWKKRPE
jgi:hypothetical protein